MKSRVITFVAFFTVAVGYPASVFGQQGIDDDLPAGAPDLFLYSDEQVELHDAIDLTSSESGWLADHGIALDADLTQFYYGVANGGREQEFRYSGHGDYVLGLDMDRLAGRQGLFVQLRAEHRFGNDINTSTGALIQHRRTDAGFHPDKFANRK